MVEIDRSVYQKLWQELFDLEHRGQYRGVRFLPWVLKIDQWIHSDHLHHRGQMVLALTFAALEMTDQEFISLRFSLDQEVAGMKRPFLAVGRQMLGPDHSNATITSQASNNYDKALRHWKNIIVRSGKAFPIELLDLYQSK